MGEMDSAFTGYSKGYIFEGAGDKRDQLEEAILKKLETNKMPLKAETRQIKSGGLFFGTKEQCIVVEGDKTFEVVIGSTAVGIFLYVEVYLNIKETLSSLFNMATDNIFKAQKRTAIYLSLAETVESAFVDLNLKESSRGFKGVAAMPKAVANKADK
jgi:hypothetical protein